MPEKQAFAKYIVKSLYQCGFDDQLSIPLNKKIMQDTASKYFTGQITEAQVASSIKDIIEDEDDRLSISIMMRFEKRKYLQSKQNTSQQKIIQRQEIIVQDEDPYGKDSEKSSSLTEQNEIQELKQKIFSSFKELKTNFNQTKGDFYQNILDIQSEVKNINNSSNIKIIQQKAKSLKVSTEKLFIICRTLVKNFQKYENELKPLVQSKQKIINKKDKKSEVSVQSFEFSQDEEQKVQKMTKKERLNLKKQQKSNEKIKRDQTQAKRFGQKSQTKEIKGSMKSQEDQDFQQENQNNVGNIQNNPALNIRRQESNNGYFELLPPQDYIERHFPKDQLHFRYNRQMRKDGNCLDRVYDKVYKLDHSNVKIDFSEFLNYDWRNVEFFNFTGCQIDSDGWNTLCMNSSLFQSLRFLLLSSNNISEVYQEQLRQFLPHMRSIIFRQRSDEKSKNPLSQQSILEIKTFLENQNEQIYWVSFK